MSTTYAKHYTRTDEPRNFKITPRVISVHADICRLPLIRKDQLRARHADIPDRVFDQIISNLFHNTFIARPRQQQEAHNTVSGSLPSYLSPDHNGLLLYEAFFADPLPAPKYTQDNDRGTWAYMRHQHSTTTGLLAYQNGAQTVSDFSFLTEPELLLRFAPPHKLNQPAFDLKNYSRLMSRDFIANPPERLKRRNTNTPLKLFARFDWPVKIPGDDELTTLEMPMTTEPDGYFAQLTGTDQPFFFESDEGTETILPNQDVRHSMQLFFQT